MRFEPGKLTVGGISPASGRSNRTAMVHTAMRKLGSANRWLARTKKLKPSSCITAHCVLVLREGV